MTISDARVLLHDGSTVQICGHSKVGKTVIGNNVFIGADAVLLPGISIGNDVVVGAGSVVTRNVPSNSVVCGNPAKVIKTYDDFREKTLSEYQSLPVFETHWSEKTLVQKEDMKLALQSTLGFDA